MELLAEFFVVCGWKGRPSVDTSLPPLSRLYAPDVLTHYPCTSRFDRNAVKTLCMPEGVQLKKNLSDPLKSFHSYLITREDGSQSHGVVLTYFEPVTDSKLIDVVESLQAEYHLIESPDLFFNQYTDVLYTQKCLCLLCSQPLVRPLKAYLDQLYACTVGGRALEDSSVESCLFNLLHEVHRPPPGGKLVFSGPLGSITWRQPSLSDLPLCDYSFVQFCDLLGVEGVLKLVACLLLEQQVLIKASSYERLMLCAHCTTALLFPFSWHHVLVPILPSSQKGFLDAPVPFLMGLCSEYCSSDGVLYESSLCSVDVDRGTFLNCDDLPALPDRERLLLQLTSALHESSVESPSCLESKHSVIEALRLLPKLSESGTVWDDLSSPSDPYVNKLIRIASRSGLGVGVGVGGAWDPSPGQQEELASRSIREVFASYFVEHFGNYENFVIVPQQSYEQWTKNREQFQNFDKTAFLSDQPSGFWPFYSLFLETALFRGFIDQKILSLWEPDHAGPNCALFDSRVDAYRDRSGLSHLPTTPTSRTDSVSGDAVEDTLAPPPTLLSETFPVAQVEKGFFPQLNLALLSQQGSKSLKSAVSPLVVKSAVPSGPRQPHGWSSHSQSRFVHQLSRESRLRVKHMLGTTDGALNYVEENTHIAYLCDLLERVWGHGLRKRESKSPLWAHLVAYVHQQNGTGTLGRKTASNLSSSMSSLNTGCGPSEHEPRDTGRALWRRTQLRQRITSFLHPPPSSLTDDFQAVNRMHELKTDVGRARAWVRLALENKSLSRHLSELLSNEEVCSGRYREYAFLRTEEEREHFLYHLLTLTARDFTCYTTGFLTTAMTYHILVVGEGRPFGLSTANVYVNLAGEYHCTGRRNLMRGDSNLLLTCQNLGPLTCMAVGHNNSGIAPGFLLHSVLVYVVTTGQTYWFNCRHWLARGEEDGSTERFLVAEKVHSIAALEVDAVLPAKGRKARASVEGQGTEVARQGLRLAVEELCSFLTHKSRDMPLHRQEVLQRVYAVAEQLSRALECGFRASRKFQKNLFVWDLIEKVLEEQRETGKQKYLLEVVTWLSTKQPNWGKKEKLVHLLCVGLRDHWLPQFIELLAQSPATALMYDPASFLLNPTMASFLKQTLTQTHHMDIPLEPLLTHQL